MSAVSFSAQAMNYDENSRQSTNVEDRTSDNFIHRWLDMIDYILNGPPLARYQGYEYIPLEEISRQFQEATRPQKDKILDMLESPEITERERKMIRNFLQEAE